MAKAATKEIDPTEVSAQESGRLKYERKFIAVTPTMAKGFLDQTHPDQRHHRDARVDQYAQDMRQGQWREDTEDAILIDWNGYLIDGQNRCRAIVESGKAVKFWVVWGVDPAVMSVKDTGAPRTVADSLRISGRGGGMTGAQLLVCGAIARRQLHWETGHHTTGSMKHGTVATHSDIAALLERQPDIYGATMIGIDASKSTRPPLVGPAVYGFFWLNANRVASDQAYQWQSFWLTPEELPGGSPISVVRERFFRSKMAKVSKSYGERRADVLSVDEQLALLIKAWNLFLVGRSVNSQRLQIVARGKLTNENFPMFLTVAEAEREAQKQEAKAASYSKGVKQSEFGE